MANFMGNWGCGTRLSWIYNATEHFFSYYSILIAALCFSLERSDYYLTVLEEAVVYAKMQGQWWCSMVQNARPDVQP